MPTGHNVVDAFKNLIRHGKHHNHRVKTQEKPNSGRTGDRNSQTQGPLDLKGNDAIEAARMIVNEEKEANAKFPSYKGLEGYRLLAKMGDGAFSHVYKAVDVASGRNVAVKIIRRLELSASQAGEVHLNPKFKKPRVTERANILKEVQIMRTAVHPSIVKLYSFTESLDHYFLTLELMDGGELFHQIVKLTYFSEELSRHIILQVAQGLFYLHEERGVVHRDIKPENLLFSTIPIVPNPHPTKRPYDEDKVDEGLFLPGVGGGGIGRIKIADFGLSKVVWNEETKTPCGTVGYTAPEIVKDERYSKSVDMWALGCVLYTILCGFPPFYDESIQALTEKVARGQYTFLSPWWDDIGASVKTLIHHLLCVNPSERYTITKFLQHPWCTREPGPLQPPPLTSPLLMRTGLRPLDSPLLRGQARDSPGIAALKEAFDITYAVHRMEEENARRRARGAGARGWLGELNEDAEDESDNGVPVQKRAPEDHKKEKERNRAVPAPATGAGGQRDRGRRFVEGGRGGRFELDLEGATLLGRRHEQQLAGQKRSGGNADGAGVTSSLAGAPADGSTKGGVGMIGSPMRVG